MKPITEQSAKGGTAAPAGKICSDTQPISEQTLTNQEIIDSYDYLSSAASAWDCTGLILLHRPPLLNWNPMRQFIRLNLLNWIRMRVVPQKYSSAYTGEKQE